LACIKIIPNNELPYLTFALYLAKKRSKDAWKYFEKGVKCIVNPDKYQTPELFMILTALKAIDENKTISLSGLNLLD